jgi:2'-5' RNA ligase
MMATLLMMLPGMFFLLAANYWQQNFARSGVGLERFCTQSQFDSSVLFSLRSSMRAKNHGPTNLFFALRPPTETSAAIDTLGAKLQRAHRLHGAKIARERLHNTLAAAHDQRRAPQEIIARARSAAKRVRHQPFKVRFEWTESFDVRHDRYPFVLRGDLKVLADFRQLLCAEMAHTGLSVPGSYTPHITLLWADRCVEAHPIAPIDWMVTDFVLISSVVGQSRHTVLDHWQLG